MKNTFALSPFALFSALAASGRTYMQLNADEEALLLDIAHSRTATAYRAQALLYTARGYEFAVELPDLSQIIGGAGFQTAFKTQATVANSFSPNPAQTTATLNYALQNADGGNETATLHIYDIVGKLVHLQTLHGTGNYTIDLSSFGQGLYVYDLSSDVKVWLRGKLSVTK